jgi:hypothetical protein
MKGGRRTLAALPFKQEYTLIFAFPPLPPCTAGALFLHQKTFLQVKSGKSCSEQVHYFFFHLVVPQYTATSTFAAENESQAFPGAIISAFLM